MDHRIVKILAFLLSLGVILFMYFNNVHSRAEEIQSWKTYDEATLMEMLEDAVDEESLQISEELEKRREVINQENKKIHEIRLAQEANQRNNKLDEESFLALAKEKRDLPEISQDTNLSTRALERALTQLGKPYEWGAVGPESFDCSGLVLWAYNQEGYFNMPRTSYVQYKTGVEVRKDSMLPGDLIYILNNPEKSPVDHVGIYMGEGRMLHAPRPGKNIEIVNVPWSRVVTIRRHS